MLCPEWWCWDWSRSLLLSSVLIGGYYTAGTMFLNLITLYEPFHKTQIWTKNLYNIIWIKLSIVVLLIELWKSIHMSFWTSEMSLTKSLFFLNTNWECKREKLKLLVFPDIFQAKIEGIIQIYASICEFSQKTFVYLITYD